jgi:hypothetical protein
MMGKVLMYEPGGVQEAITKLGGEMRKVEESATGF